MTKERSNIVPIRRRQGVSDVFGIKLDPPVPNSSPTGDTPASEAQSRDEQRKPGRPLGSKTQDVPHVEAILTRCRDCGSTERAEYTNYREHAGDGVTTDGRPFTHTVWRDTKCLSCGQRRCDITRENRV